MTVQLLAGGRIAFDMTGDGLSAPLASQRRLMDGDVLHLRHRSEDGVLGIAPLRHASYSAESASAVFAYSRSGWSNDTVPGGVLEAKQGLKPETIERLRASLQDYRAEANRGKALILEHGLKFNRFEPMSPEDAELLASRRFTVEDIARVFRVPPPMIGDLTNSSFTNSETMLRYFAQNTLSYWARRI